MGDVLALRENVTSDGIEPPLSDLESEVLPLHHEASVIQAAPLHVATTTRTTGAQKWDIR